MLTTPHCRIVIVGKKREWILNYHWNMHGHIAVLTLVVCLSIAFDKQNYLLTAKL